MNLRRRICHLLSLLRIHIPDCEHRNAHETRGREMRERLEELGWRTQPRSLKNKMVTTMRTAPGMEP